MELELVTIGTELLLGTTVDTNTADISRALASVGVRVVRTTAVGDDAGGIEGAVREALERTQFVITTGGLGPTRDDITKMAVAAVFDVPLLNDDAYERHLEQWWQRLRRPGAMPEANRSQALIPRGAEVILNARGTAPALWVEGAPGTVVLLPGVPQEVRGLMAEEICPRLAQRLGGEGPRSRVLRTAGISESALADLIGPLEDRLAPVTVAYLPTFGGVDLRLTVWDAAADGAASALETAQGQLAPLLGDHLYAEGDTDLAAVVLHGLGDLGVELAVAESCTGGLIGARITDVPGASAVYAGGVVAYADAVKVRELAVPADVLAAEGAVSEPVVRAMAEGVARRFGCRAAVAVSGVAGPSGGTAEKPVGTVCISGVVLSHARTLTAHIPGDRHAVRARAAQAALFVLKRLLDAERAGRGAGATL